MRARINQALDDNYLKLLYKIVVLLQYNVSQIHNTKSGRTMKDGINKIDLDNQFISYFKTLVGYDSRNSIYPKFSFALKDLALALHIFPSKYKENIYHINSQPDFIGISDNSTENKKQNKMENNCLHLPYDQIHEPIQICQNYQNCHNIQSLSNNEKKCFNCKNSSFSDESDKNFHSIPTTKISNYNLKLDPSNSFWSQKSEEISDMQLKLPQRIKLNQKEDVTSAFYHDNSKFDNESSKLKNLQNLQNLQYFQNKQKIRKNEKLEASEKLQKLVINKNEIEGNENL